MCFVYLKLYCSNQSNEAECMHMGLKRWLRGDGTSCTCKRAALKHGLSNTVFVYAACNRDWLFTGRICMGSAVCTLVSKCGRNTGIQSV